MIEGTPQSSIVKVSMSLYPDQLEKVHELQALLGSPNEATAMFNAAAIVNDLMDRQEKGWKLRLVKRLGRRWDDPVQVYEFKLPTRRGNPITKFFRRFLPK